MFKTNYNLSLVRYLLTLSLGLFMLIASPVTIAAVHKSAKKIASPAKIAPPAKTLTKPLDKIIAIINDEIVTSTQWQQAIVAAKQQLQASNTALPADSVLRKQVLDQLIVKSLQMQIVKKSGIKITATQVNAGLNSMAEKNNISLDQLRSKIEGSGMSFRHYREQMKQQMAIMQLQSMAISKQISITPQEVDTAMLQLSLSSPLKYHYGDILISLPETPTSQQVKTALAKAKKVVKQLRRPRADFKKIAAANSASAQALMVVIWVGQL
jgi:peptidyl-prolyl cis-trans isomerase SurA